MSTLYTLSSDNENERNYQSAVGSPRDILNRQSQLSSVRQSLDFGFSTTSKKQSKVQRISVVDEQTLKQSSAFADGFFTKRKTFQSQKSSKSPKRKQTQQISSKDLTNKFMSPLLKETKLDIIQRVTERLSSPQKRFRQQVFYGDSLQKWGSDSKNLNKNTRGGEEDPVHQEFLKKFQKLQKQKQQINEKTDLIQNIIVILTLSLTFLQINKIESQIPEKQVQFFKQDLNDINIELRKTTFDDEYKISGRYLKRKDKYPYSLLSKADILDLEIKTLKV
eukprot:403341878